MRRRVLLVPVAATVMLACALKREGDHPAALADPASRRAVQSGLLVGTAGRYGGNAWLGIPFAKPPVDALRWRAPLPPDAWSGTREAVRFASPCSQLAAPFGGIYDVKRGEPAGSEDCLYLNVWTPAFPGGHLPTGTGRLPVMVWTHGGGNSLGHGGFFDGSKLASTQGVVVITLNYRLGPFGWFRHPALRGEGTSDAERSGNFGTLDLVRALEWVRDNVAAFGGDPHKVTIFGESAGGTNVATLLVSPLAHRLFQRAILQSSGLHASSVDEGEHLQDEPVPGHRHSSGELLLDLLVREGTAADRAAAKARVAAMTPDEIARYLRGKSSAELLRATAPGNFGGLLDFPQVFLDGVVLPPEKPFDLLGRRGAYARVPIMLGTTRDEVKLFQFTNPDLVRRWFGVIPRVRDPERYQLGAEYGSMLWKAGAADEVAMRLLKAQGPSVYVYRFDWDEEPRIWGSDLSLLVGAAHAFEVPFVFGHFDLGREGNVIWTEANAPGRQALSAAMMSYWAAFAYAGTPGRGRHGELPRWAPWGEEGETFMVLDTPADGGIRMTSDVVTKASVVAQIDADPRLPTQRDRCERFADLALHSQYFTRAEYPAAGAHGCAEYPLDHASP